MPTWEDSPTDEKYIVFNRQAFLEYATPKAVNMATAEMVYQGWEGLALKDAVVIRRQDKFASPCLATYAAMIGLVASEHTDPKIRADLLDISDYFERQAQLAAEEGFKLPDL